MMCHHSVLTLCQNVVPLELWHHDGSYIAPYGVFVTMNDETAKQEGPFRTWSPGVRVSTGVNYHSL